MAGKMDAPKWLDEGKDFIAKAEAELAAGNYGMSCYYSNQAIDRYIKGIMLKVTGNELTGHSLIYNCRQTSHFHKKLMMVLGDCAQMENYWYDAAAGESPKDASKAEAEKGLASAKKMPTMV